MSPMTDIETRAAKIDNLERIGPGGRIAIVVRWGLEVRPDGSDRVYDRRSLVELAERIKPRSAYSGEDFLISVVRNVRLHTDPRSESELTLTGMLIVQAIAENPYYAGVPIHIIPQALDGKITHEQAMKAKREIELRRRFVAPSYPQTALELYESLKIADILNAEGIEVPRPNDQVSQPSVPKKAETEELPEDALTQAEIYRLFHRFHEMVDPLLSYYGMQLSVEFKKEIAEALMEMRESTEGIEEDANTSWESLAEKLKAIPVGVRTQEEKIEAWRIISLNKSRLVREVLVVYALGKPEKIQQFLEALKPEKR